MNFDTLNMEAGLAPAEADWGIEEPVHTRKRFDSVSTGDFRQPQKIREFYGKSPTLYNRSGSLEIGSETHSEGFSSSEYRLRPRQGSEYDYGKRHEVLRKNPATTENFRKFIAKYLCIQPSRASMVERFKYNLMLSNLLDDSLVLSKNEQVLASFKEIKLSEGRELPVSLKRVLYDDGTRLKIVRKEYSLTLPALLRHPLVLLNTIKMIVFLMKQRRKVHSKMKKSSQLKMFKVLMIFATRILKVRRAQITIDCSRTLRCLQNFLITNCGINKAIISHIISLKEADMFSFLQKATQDSPADTHSRNLKKHLDTLLTCLITNVMHSIRTVLPLCDGNLLEQYCKINNVRVSAIYDSHDHFEDTLTLEKLTAKLSSFNTIRRFFVCELLTIHERALHTYFLSTLADHLNIVLKSAPPFQNFSSKSAIVYEVLSSHTAMVERLHTFDDQFRSLHSPPRSSDFANDDILSTHETRNCRDLDNLTASDSDSKLNNLIDKMSSLATSLKYFKKYSESIASIENLEEQEERLSIFSSFENELQNCTESFNVCLNDYKADFQKLSEALTDQSSCSHSHRNSCSSDDQFNLKTFHTSTKTKKPVSSLNVLESRVCPKPKRSSTGLQLGLVTVLEDPRQGIISHANSAKGVENGSIRESYNSNALEALTRKPFFGHPSDRFSMASVNSNVSGISELIASTQITTDDDDGLGPRTEYLLERAGKGMSKEDLEKKLEQSFTRIYNLQNENHELKSMTSSSKHGEEPICSGAMESRFRASKDSKFLQTLEETLDSKSPAADFA
ncbi:hypothetical protein OXX79_006469 [Metschnikowia pulcherrima]